MPTYPFPSQLDAPSPAWTHTCGRGGHKGVYVQIAWSPSKWHSHHCSLPVPLVLQLQTYKEETEGMTTQAQHSLLSRESSTEKPYPPC